MRLLVLGGTMFLSRAVAEEAVRRGHDVDCACRGRRDLPPGVGHVALDRASQDPATVLVGGYDAVVDVARHPSWVRAAVAAVPDAHWVFVSTVSVYGDAATPGGGPGSLPLVPAIDEDVDLGENPEAYGGMKVACERAVLERAPGATVIRPGLIVGPGDPTGRFAYWPERLADGGPVLAPAPPETPVQVIDVRDLASWMVDCAETRPAAVVDGVGPVRTWQEFVTDVAAGVVPDPPQLRWIDSGRLAELGVSPWSGPGSLPVWLPPEEYAGMLAHDPAPAESAGLVTRPLAATARDTLDWLRSDPSAVRTGLSREEEAELLHRASG